MQILAPLVRGRKGEHKKLLEEVRQEGFVRVRVNGEVRTLDEPIELEKQKKHTIEVVVDRVVVREGIETRLADSLQTALARGDGLWWSVRRARGWSPRSSSSARSTPAPSAASASAS